MSVIAGEVQSQPYHIARTRWIKFGEYSSAAFNHNADIVHAVVEVSDGEFSFLRCLPSQRSKWKDDPRVSDAPSILDAF